MYKANTITMTTNHLSKHICAYEEDGCTFTCFDDREMDDHMMTADISHQIMAAMKKQMTQTCLIFDSYVEKIMEKLVTLESEVSRLHNYIEWEITSGQSRLTEELQEVSRKQETLEGNVSKLHRQLSWDVTEELKKISRNQESLDESLDDALQNRTVVRQVSSTQGTSVDDEIKEISRTQEVMESELCFLRQDLEKDVCERLKTISSRQEAMNETLDEIQHKQEVLSVGLDRIQESQESVNSKLTELEVRATPLSPVPNQTQQAETVSLGDKSLAKIPDEQVAGYLTRADMDRLEKLEEAMMQLEGKVSIVTDLTVQAGTHLWKIQNFTRLLELGRAQEEFYIYSPEFYTDSKGYKMCLFMCPNGHMNGRDTHVSLYLQILRGPHDDELAWPFKHTICMETLDMSGSGQHKEFVFEPCLQEPERECWVKPHKDRKNIGYGDHRFLAHTHLEGPGKIQYLRDDTLYVRLNIGG